jgi:CRP/FNR family transcriptional regulator
VRGASICAVDDAELQAELDRISTIRRLEPGDVLVSGDDPSQVAGHVLDGVIRLQRTAANGRRLIVSLLTEGDMFGQVIRRMQHFTVEAATPARVCCFERAALERLVEANPALQHRLLLVTLERMDWVLFWTWALGCLSAEERVAAFLLVAARRKPFSVPGAKRPTVEIPISRPDFAAHLGTRAETLSRSLHDLARQEVIEILDPQHFEIVDMQRLAEISQVETGLLDHLFGAGDPPARRPAH